MRRIGELSRRVGISEHVLRAWEQRYGLLQPVRSAGGFRLYTDADEERVRRMQAHIAQGHPPAEAARITLAEDGAEAARREPTARASAASPEAQVASARAELERADLTRALDAFDEAAAQRVLDRLLSELSVEAVLRDVVLPYLAALGERWERGLVSVAQEHFASNVIRGRLAGLARGWGSGVGPRAVLACPPGEEHELALMAFGIALNRLGWRIDYLGANTPLDELDRAVDVARPDLVVLAATVPGTLEPARRGLAALASKAPLALAGAAVTPKLATAVRGRHLASDPVTAAEQTASAGRAPISKGR